MTVTIPEQAAGAREEYVPTRVRAPAALWITRIAQGVTVLGAIALARMLPAAKALDAAVAWVEGLGSLAPVAFVALYVAITISMFPASLLSLAAGALFGLAAGTLLVAVGATLGMAATFLIARYLARPAVARRMAHYPRFAAVDRAVGEGGWKVVALLRLSPALPFNLQNYLYGLTAIRFWPCILASAVAILPGTFMYVYLGHAGRAGLSALGGAETGRGPGQWALLAIGLAATVAVTVYVTKLARNVIREQAEMGGDTPAAAEAEGAPKPARRPWAGVLANVAVALLVLGAVGCAQFQPRWIVSLFGPPEVRLAEAYAAGDGGAVYDHGAFDAILRRHVNAQGGVDYAALRADPEPLRAYTAALAEAPFDALGRDEKLALLINAYNAFTLQLIVEWPDEGLRSIRDIPPAKRWDHARWEIGGNSWSLNQIEHAEIRPKFAEPNIHWALVCAALSCPPLRPEAYTGARVQEQLADQARIVHTDGSRWFTLAPGGESIGLTPLYDWYASDFEQVGGDVLDYAARYSPELAARLEASTRPAVEWLEYDWALNNQENLN